MIELGAGLALLADLVLTDVPDVTASAARTSAFYADPSQRTTAVAAFYVAALAVALVVPALVSSWPDRPRPLLARVGLLATGGWAVCYLAAAAAFAAPAVTVSLWGSAQVDVEFARAMSSWGDALLMLAAPLCFGAALAAALRMGAATGRRPRWLTGAGYLVAVGQLAGVLWFPLVAAVLWMVVAGVRDLLAGGGRNGDPDQERVGATRGGVTSLPAGAASSGS